MGFKPKNDSGDGPGAPVIHPLVKAVQASKNLLKHQKDKIDVSPWKYLEIKKEIVFLFQKKRREKIEKKDNIGKTNEHFAEKSMLWLKNKDTFLEGFLLKNIEKGNKGWNELRLKIQRRLGKKKIEPSETYAINLEILASACCSIASNEIIKTAKILMKLWRAAVEKKDILQHFGADVDHLLETRAKMYMEKVGVFKNTEACNHLDEQLLSEILRSFRILKKKRIRKNKKITPIKHNLVSKEVEIKE